MTNKKNASPMGLTEEILDEADMIAQGMIVQAGNFAMMHGFTGPVAKGVSMLTISRAMALATVEAKDHTSVEDLMEGIEIASKMVTSHALRHYIEKRDPETDAEDLLDAEEALDDLTAELEGLVAAPPIFVSLSADEEFLMLAKLYRSRTETAPEGCIVQAITGAMLIIHAMSSAIEQDPEGCQITDAKGAVLLTSGQVMATLREAISKSLTADG